MSQTADPRHTLLATGFTVADYERARDAGDRETIAEGIRRRFTERYIEPVSRNPKGGFAMMAVACLMIEALESFRKGWKTSEGKSEGAFCSFFDRAEAFKTFRGHAQNFYKHVRCGILHQAETTGGWRIRQSGPLFAPDSRTINATRFLDTLKQDLDNYCNELKSKSAPWDSPEWKNVRDKMNAIAQHCRTTG